VSSCGHEFCGHCFQRWTVEQGKHSCPTCRRRLAPGAPAVCRLLQRTVAALFPAVGGIGGLARTQGMRLLAVGVVCVKSRAVWW
jgi:hypothetical protein